jgi:hypothetical protein
LVKVVLKEMELVIVFRMGVALVVEALPVDIVPVVVFLVVVLLA